MKRLFICVLVFALGIVSGAFADASFWTRNDDIYYHAEQVCAGEGCVPISEEAALAFAKYACPVCCLWPDGGEEPKAASRGGTIVVRFSDAWLDEMELTEVFGWQADNSYGGAQARRNLAEYLHGEAYADFTAELAAEGAADGRVNTPHILAADGALVMSRRHIGNHWYVIVRPQENFGSTWDMYWRVNSLGLHMEDEELRTQFDLQTVEELRSLQLTRMNDSDPVYTRAADELEMAVYQALEGNIAVVREKKPEERKLENVQLRIAGVKDPIALAGYAEGRDAVYCCMLTDGELEALRRNAGAELWHLENINSGVYRVDGADAYTYYSAEDDRELFSLERTGGQADVDHDFLLVLDGEPDRFAALNAIYDYEGRRHGVSGEYEIARLTPLVWNGDKGVFLAEGRESEEHKNTPLLTDGGIEIGVRYEIDTQKEWGEYSCWLVDENGGLLSDRSNQGFMIHPDGRIELYDWEGMSYAGYIPETGD